MYVSMGMKEVETWRLRMMEYRRCFHSDVSCAVLAIRLQYVFFSACLGRIVFIKKSKLGIDKMNCALMTRYFHTKIFQSVFLFFFFLVLSLSFSLSLSFFFFFLQLSQVTTDH